MINFGDASPKINQVQVTRQELPTVYLEVLAQNDLLARIEGNLKTHNWSDLEIRTCQLLTACRSNASLLQRLKELESSLAKV